ncbi:MAG: cytidylate kinase-like family protein [Clostridiales bacterium]|nr:cytidylate kinase-like family protein [Clostridiales bacterium]
MENNHEKCLELAKRIYDLDTNVYQLSGSSLGRTFSGDKDTHISNLATLIYTRPQGHLLRSEIALIGNMARTIRNKTERSRMMTEYNEILKEIEQIPASFGSVDIVDEQLATLNISNLHREKSPDDHLIICIGRTHGSAGTDIGFALADALKINYYDVEIFNQVLDRLEAEKDSISDRENFATKLDQVLPDTHVKRRISDFSRYHGLPKKDAVFFNQSDLIRDMAKKEDFIVMGRCADVILTNNRIPHISIFITAPFHQRVRRMMEVNHLEFKEACKLLKKLDRQHERYYNFYTGRKWGDAVNYDLCINSACYGIKESVELIERMIDKYPTSH